MILKMVNKRYLDRKVLFTETPLAMKNQPLLLSTVLPRNNHVEHAQGDQRDRNVQRHANGSVFLKHLLQLLGLALLFLLRTADVAACCHGGFAGVLYTDQGETL